MDQPANTNGAQPAEEQPMPPPVEAPPSLQQALAQQVNERMQSTVGALFRQVNEQAALNSVLVAELKKRDETIRIMQGEARLRSDELSLARAEIAILRGEASGKPAPVPSRNPQRRRK